MSRFVYGMLFAFGLTVCSFTVGCGDGGNQVIEDTRTDTEVQQSDEEYEKSMEEGDKESEAGDK